MMGEAKHTAGRKHVDPVWTIEDYTSKKAGYMRIFCNGERAADVFPFAKGEDPEVVKDRALTMVAILNESTLTCADCGVMMTPDSAEGREDGLFCDACLNKRVEAAAIAKATGGAL